MEPPKKKVRISEDTENQHTNTDNCNSETKALLKDLEICQNDLDGLAARLNNELVRTEQKFTQIRQGNIKKRSRLISKISNFWKIAIQNHPRLTCFLNDDNEKDCFKYLTKLHIEDTSIGYKIDFHFSENPYFENNVLTKEFQWGYPQDTNTCVPIKWKSDFNLSQSDKQDKESTNSSTETPKNKKHKLEHDSFVTWYTSNDHECNTVGELIRSDLWCNPLKYFRNEYDKDLNEYNRAADEQTDDEGV